MFSMRLEGGLCDLKVVSHYLTILACIWSLAEDLASPEDIRKTRQNWNQFSERCIPSWANEEWV